MNHSRGGAQRSAGPVISLDIGGTSIRGGIVTDGARPEVQLHHRQPTEAEDGGPAVLRRALAIAQNLHALVPETRGISVACAGVIDPADGTVTSATELMPGWAGTDVGGALRAQTGLNCTVLNDVHAHALGEFHYGAGRGCASALVVAVGTGLGGGFLSGGQLVRGAGGLAGHVGHIHHPAASGLRCTCGRSGHLESVASGSGLTARYQERRGANDPNATDGAAVAAHAARGIQAAERALRVGGTALGECLGSLANAWAPERIILSGSVTGAGDIWWQAVREGYSASAMTPLQLRPIVLGELGDDAPLIGAAAMHRSNA
ncbi:ROK family protein [Nesterenkonia haasae]|uniref:ROK family protein n=1 Tax=Nesterenkonia haasae TaxID=2587813 RepID=UPI001390A317|nr:ROK family protein [Nesterenkonia haasae]NDK31684.1 ROK family protein [Nesterenkonia haasae]